MGWISDFFRLAWGFLYWNTRKTVYRLRQTRGTCPCQHPSDSGRAGETGCAAVAHWKSPARFQRLCPLLRQNQTGAWRCSVDRREAKPFWGRAGRFYGSALLIVYLTTTLTAFVFLRQIGYRVTYPGVLWPPAWTKLPEIRSEFFFQKYQAASAAGDMHLALMALSTAYNLAPQNYAAGRQLAQLWQTGQPDFANQIYRRLLNEHPAEAEATAQAWFRALLARGDFAGVEALASERITTASDHADAWLNAFLFANRHTRDVAARQRLEAAPTLTPAARFLLALEDELNGRQSPLRSGAPTGDSSIARARLLKAAASSSDALSFFHVCQELIARGFASDALHEIDHRPGLLGPRDLTSLRLDAFAALGWDATLRSEVEALLMAPPNPATIELLSAHLIRHPDASVRELVFARLDQKPLPATAESYPSYLSLLGATAVGHDAARLHWTVARIKEIVGDHFHGLDALGETLLDDKRRGPIENYLPALQPLSLEVSYALLDHYAPIPR